MHVLVTGGTGTVGRRCVARLVHSGHEVRVIGLDKNLDIPGADFRTCDITDYAATREQMDGIEGVVHLAAIPSPMSGTTPDIFHINCTGTFNVYQTAAEAGIKRVVSASSINALGFNFGVQPFQLSYFPLDEEHSTQTTDVYSLSKQFLEETAEYFWRRDGISGVCLRLPAVHDPDDKERARRMGGQGRAYGELMELPEAERQDRAAEIWAQVEQSRRERASEKPRQWRRGQKLTPEQEKAFVKRRMTSALPNFWTGIHAEDSAQAFEKGLTADYEGAHPLFVTQATNRAGVESEALLQLFFPDIPARKRQLEGDESIVSIDRARALIGFAPEHTLD